MGIVTAKCLLHLASFELFQLKGQREAVAEHSGDGGGAWKFQSRALTPACVSWHLAETWVWVLTCALPAPKSL